LGAKHRALEIQGREQKLLPVANKTRRPHIVCRRRLDVTQGEPANATNIEFRREWARASFGAIDSQELAGEFLAHRRKTIALG